MLGGLLLINCSRRPPLQLVRDTSATSTSSSDVTNRSASARTKAPPWLEPTPKLPCHRTWRPAPP